MASTKQSQTVALINELLGYAGSFQNLWIAIHGFLQRNTDDAPATTWAAFPTAALNTDGSLGAADGTPNAAHPIDIRIAAMAGLNRAVAANDLSNLLSLLSDFDKFMTNQAVAAGNRIGVVDVLTG